MIYLDNAASTQIHNEVYEEMVPFLKEQYGNPSSIHKLGRRAEKAINNARKNIADLISAKPEEIFLTSGGTESNNTALRGIATRFSHGHIITTQIEHEAILEPCKKLEQEGFRLSYLPVTPDGLVEPEDLRKTISEDTFLVSLMFANNEIGTIQPIESLSKICKENNVIFHSDAVQAVGKIPINVRNMGIDLLSISSHKINGPKGIGALYVKSDIGFSPLILGGGQEKGMRSGTENVANIVGFGKACQIAKLNQQTNLEYVANLRDHLVDRITNEIPQVTYNGDSRKRLPNNAHFTFLGVNGEDLIIKLDEHNIFASTGSACSVKTQKASHVLQAMGFSHEKITGSLRLTLGIYNTEEEIDKAVDVLKEIVGELRQFSPFKEKYGF